MAEYRLQFTAYERNLADWKKGKLASELPPAEPEEPKAERSIVSDTTVEGLAPVLLNNPRGVLLARDELAGWWGSFDRYASGKGGSDSANWLSMYNAEEITIDRKSGPTIVIPQAAVLIVGGIQPGVLNRSLGVEHIESGMAARLLLTCPPRSPKEWREAEIDAGIEQAVAAVINRLYDLQPIVDNDGEDVPACVKLSAAAKKLWVEFYNAHNRELNCLTGNMAAVWSKLEEYTARLALVVHFVRWAAGDADHDTLDAESMKAGIDLCGWFKNEARRVYGILGRLTESTEADKLVAWIEKRGGSVTAREVQMGYRSLRGSGQAGEALEGLAEADLGRWEESIPDEKGGRPTRRFVLTDGGAVNNT